MPRMFYVYTLSAPPEMGGAVFYVGKGVDNRIDLHECAAKGGSRHSACINVIRQIWAEGRQVVKVKVLETTDENKAFDEERRLIAFYGSSLVNRTGGGEGRAGVPRGDVKSRTVPGTHVDGSRLFVELRHKRRKDITIYELADEIGVPYQVLRRYIYNDVKTIVLADIGKIYRFFKGEGLASSYADILIDVFA